MAGIQVVTQLLLEQSHIPTVVQVGGRGGEGGWDPSTWVFVMLQYFEKISPFI